MTIAKDNEMAASILRSAHVGFTVSSLDRSIRLFETLFGYDFVSRAGRNAKGVALVLGVENADIEVAHLHHQRHIGIELIEFRAPADRSRVDARPCDVGFTHFTFDVSDVDAVVAAAAAHDLFPVGRILTSDGGPNKGGRAVYMRDTDGITIELIQPATIPS